MSEIHAMHKSFFRTLCQVGAAFDPAPAVLNQKARASRMHECHCEKCFTTPQGLACHRRRRHGEYAPERDLVDGATCPEWFLWTKQRLFQQLSYISRRTHTNRCFQALKNVDTPLSRRFGDYHKLPKSVGGLNRAEALQTLCPTRPGIDVVDGA